MMLSAGYNEGHRPPRRCDKALAARTLDDLTIGSFDADLAGNGIDGFRSGMAMNGRCEARGKHRLHVDGSVFARPVDWQWADLCDTLTTARPPTVFGDCEKPDLVRSLDDGATRSLVCLG